VTSESNGDSSQARPTSSVRWQRLGAVVATDLRDRILTGDLANEELLPKEDDLRHIYPVSKASIREALRILEAEGLITVRRGNQGGSLIRRPTAANVAYALALVLRAGDVKIEHVATALQETEPVCAALCARRADRAETVVPQLRALHESGMRQIDDVAAVVALSRSFHEAMVDHCGNGALKVVVGALEAIWSTHERTWSRTSPARLVQLDDRYEALRAHERILEAIEQGEPAAAHRLAAGHLQVVQSYPTADASAGVLPELVREHLLRAFQIPDGAS